MPVDSGTGLLRVTDAALIEATAVAQQYESARPGYGDLFQHRLNECFTRIAEHPESYQRMEHHYRRVFLRHFPFMVVYRIKSDHVEVVGVSPQRDDPKVIARRLASDDE